MDAGRHAGDRRRLVSVDDRVGETANARDNRRSAISERAELSEATRLETRGHDNEIGAGLNEMGQLLIVAEYAGNRVLASMRRLR